MCKLIKQVLLAAAAFFLSLTAAFPAFAQEAGTETVMDDDYVNAGPGAVQVPVEEEPEEPEEVSLGLFTVTGYCGCDRCSGGHNLTYSGTVPTPNHTISADISQYPIGTKLRIGDVVYTVEDKGSSVRGNVVDIFYSSHQEALDKGTYTAEVFLVQE